MANAVAISNSKFSELFESKYGENMINVPRTIPNPGKASTMIFAEGVVIVPFEELHPFKTRTNIRGDTNLNIKVKIAKGQRRWGEVDAK